MLPLPSPSDTADAKMRQLREDYADMVGHLTSQGFIDAEIANELRRTAGEVSSFGFSCMLLPCVFCQLRLCVFVFAVAHRGEACAEAIGDMKSQGFTDDAIQAMLEALSVPSEVVSSDGLVSHVETHTLTHRFTL